MEIKSNYIPHNFRNKYLKNVGGSYSTLIPQHYYKIFFLST